MELEIFVNFVIDKSLPKWAVEKKVEVPGDSNDPMSEEEGGGDKFTVSVSRQAFNMRLDTQPATPPVPLFGTRLGQFEEDSDEFTVKTIKPRRTLKSRILGLLFSSATKEPKKDPPKEVDWFFKAVFNSLSQAEKFNEDSAALVEQVAQAKQLGQQALLEKLITSLDIKLYENQLIAVGQGRYITDSNVIKFATESMRGLRLDWIRNFIRPIPSAVGILKIDADKLKVFDNYVILHYDPEGKATAMTIEEEQAELARRRDPILFGVISGSRKLYFIADWKDEICDLTFTDLLERLSNPASQLHRHGPVLNQGVV